MSDESGQDGGGRRAWESVIEHIEARLLAGDLVPGDRLPGERALSSDLGVGRSSVREALRVLEVLGLIRTATGSGPTSGAIIVATPQGGMSALMRLQVAAHGFPVADIVSTRLIVETAIASQLATGDADLAEARVLLDAMDDETLTTDEFLALDASFHLALASAAGNQVLIATMAGLRHGIEEYARVGSARLDDWTAATADLRAQHRAIVAAIDAGDPDAARTAVHDHISGYYAAISHDPMTEGH